MSNYIYKSGIPFSNCLRDQIEEGRERIMGAGLTAGMIIAGTPGKGKTTLAVHVAEYYQGKPINFKEQVGYGWEDFKLKYGQYKGKYSVFIYDEGGDMSRRRAMSGNNVDFTYWADKMRKNKTYLIFAVQRFHEMDYGIIGTELFRCVVYIPRKRKNDADFYIYAIPAMVNMRNLWDSKKIRHPPLLYRSHKALPCAGGHFLPFPPEKNKEMIRESDEGKDQAAYALGFSMLKLSDLMRLFNLSNGAIRARIRKLNIKPSLEKGNTKYYDPSVIDELKKK